MVGVGRWLEQVRVNIHGCWRLGCHCRGVGDGRAWARGDIIGAWELEEGTTGEGVTEISRRVVRHCGVFVCVVVAVGAWGRSDRAGRGSTGGTTGKLRP